MNNIMKLNDYSALIVYDPDIDMFRGEILGLNGEADFYGKNPEELKKEFAISLKVFLDMCNEDGVNPLKHYSGKLNVRLPQELHKKACIISSANGKSLNQFIVDSIAHEIEN